MFKLAPLTLFALLLTTATSRPPPEDTAPTLPSSITLSKNIVRAVLPPRNPSRTGSRDGAAFKALQLNLCNSGFAKCYSSGAAIAEGSAKIASLKPNVVTINEICKDDVARVLHPALSRAWPADYTYSVFNPAIDKRNNGPYKCKNGDAYGNAVLGRVAAGKWSDVAAYGAKYAAQVDGNEQRTFACAHAVGDHFACSTHLAASDEPTALAQCKALMFDAVPYLKRLAGASSAASTVVGGDFNLEYDKADKENAQKCVPNGYTRKGDGDVQHVVFSNDLHFEDTVKHAMKRTDHKAFEVKLTR